MQGEHYAAEGSQPVYSAEGSQPMYQAEGSQPVATGTVVQQEPVVLSGTVVGMEQPAATTYAVQQPAAPTYTVQQPGKIPVVIAGAPPPTMVEDVPPRPGRLELERNMPRETRRCECEDGFSRPGPPLSQALHFELSTQNGKDQAYSQYIYGFGCRMRFEITATQASASAGSSARNG